VERHELERIKQTGDYALEVEDAFDGPALNRDLWLPHYLPQWSSRKRSAARYNLGDGQLHLRIEPDQPAWCPEFDGTTRVSSVQTGGICGPTGEFHRAAPIRRAPSRARGADSRRSLHTPLQPLRAGRTSHCAPDAMVAFWMIGFEDQPHHSAEICVCEIFGRNIESGRAGIGMGVHPFGDPTILDEFSTEWLPIDPSELHLYSVEWTAQHVAFFLDEKLVKVVRQSPSYPMQFMLGIYQFPQVGASQLHSPMVFSQVFYALRIEATASLD
jgi:hypothetical protein